MSTYYEPWKPAVGDRVVIHPGKECAVQSHAPDGTLGTVTEISWDEEVNGPEPIDLDPEDADSEGESYEEQNRAHRAYGGHWYIVDYDVPDCCVKWDFYAAAELELVPREQARARTEETSQA